MYYTYHIYCPSDTSILHLPGCVCLMRLENVLGSLEKSFVWHFCRQSGSCFTVGNVAIRTKISLFNHPGTGSLCKDFGHSKINLFFGEWDKQLSLSLSLGCPTVSSRIFSREWQYDFQKSGSHCILKFLHFGTVQPWARPSLFEMMVTSSDIEYRKVHGTQCADGEYGKCALPVSQLSPPQQEQQRRQHH